MTLDDPDVVHDEVDDDYYVLGQKRRCRCGELLVPPTYKTYKGLVDDFGVLKDAWKVYIPDAG